MFGEAAAGAGDPELQPCPGVGEDLVPLRRTGRGAGGVVSGSVGGVEGGEFFDEVAVFRTPDMSGAGVGVGVS